MFISTLVIATVMFFIVLSVVLLTPPEDENANKGRRMDFGDFLSDNLTANRFNGSWVSGELNL